MAAERRQSLALLPIRGGQNSGRLVSQLAAKMAHAAEAGQVCVLVCALLMGLFTHILSLLLFALVMSALFVFVQSML